ncbi:MAG: HAD family hydrolase [Calothrix sp. MO_167.B12]|nr:HAD family hydrolase [Calothrix sp. MO_167.B12]
MNFKTMNRKTLGFFLSVLLSIFCLGGTFGCLPAHAAGEQFLDSWNNTGRKQAIIDFVNKVTNDGNYYVLPKDRIAVFDNDGTLWAERPQYFQQDFIESQSESVSKVKFNKLLKTTQKEIDTNGAGNISDEIKSVLSDIAVFEGITTDSYIQLAHDFVYGVGVYDNIKHPEYDAEYIQLTYKPVIDLVKYLKANGFKVYICSGGGVDFVRSFAEDAYGIPPEKVIGSAVKTKYDETEGPGGNLVRQAMLAQYNDQQGKPVGIERHIGKRPILAVGNSGGDLEMFKYTNADEDKSLIVLINHDDCQREYKYNDIPGGANGENESLDEAQGRDNWIVVSMKDDFQTIFASDPQRPDPSCPSQ